MMSRQLNTHVCESRSPSCPLVSVIIPVKNRSMLVCEAVESVQRQTYQYWEAIVVDDGSSDQTVQRVSALAAEDPRICLMVRDEPRSGAPVCRNIGFGAARGEYVIFLDSDDLLAARCLENRVRVMEDNRQLDFAVFATQGFEQIPGDRDCLVNVATGEDDLVRFLLFDVPWQTSGPIWRMEAIEKIGPWDEQLPVGQDMDMGTRALIANLSYIWNEKIDSYYRLRADSRGTIGITAWLPENLPWQEHRVSKTLKLLREARRLTPDLKMALAANYLWLAKLYRDTAGVTDSLAVWNRCRTAALVSQWIYWLGTAYLLCGRSWLAGFAVNLLYHAAPLVIAFDGRHTFLNVRRDGSYVQEPLDLAVTRSLAYRYGEIIKVGTLRYIARLLRPVRLTHAIRRRFSPMH